MTRLRDLPPSLDKGSSSRTEIVLISGFRLLTSEIGDRRRLRFPSFRRVRSQNTEVGYQKASDLLRYATSLAYADVVTF